MKTKLLYLEDSYKKKATAKIISIEEVNNLKYIILDQTIFYPQGGGQPTDQGEIINQNGKLQVTHVSYHNGSIQHKGKIEGFLNIGDSVELLIDWKNRYHNIQLHTAGHILDQAVKNIVKESIAIDGNHGISKKCYIEYTTNIPKSALIQIKNEVRKIVDQNLNIKTEMITHEQLIDRNIKLPFDLPKNKDLKILQIGDYSPMPDSGTHLKTTGESWPIEITEVKQKKGNWRVYYQTINPDQKIEPIKKQKIVVGSKDTQSLPKLKKAIQKLKQQFDAEAKTDVENLHHKYLGKKGLTNGLMRGLKNVPQEMRPLAGQLLNELKNNLQHQLELLSDDTSQKNPDKIDLTIPGLRPSVGHVHPVSQAIKEITHIFEKIGFTRVRYPEVDWDYYVFESLNMPPDHPARDEWETFFVDSPQHNRMGKMILTTHTSNGQVREMERLKSKPPIRMINIARCYRRQQDATHTQMFHQFEGLVVDKGINIQHLKGTLDHFAEQFYGPGTKSRIRPSHFQFTEPSFEVDFSCHICHGTGKKGKTKCKFCKSGWHEVGGAGMVHPNVLKAGGIDPDEYTGFAFGWGIERTYTLKEGLNIDDIRLIYSGDLRFLEQF